ncbi:MAG: efflux RND transporter periplasmic adaptor subunit [Terriglobales bacterium]|jgi:HlyD family secretion protein
MTKKTLTIVGSAIAAIILLLTIISARGDKMSVRSDVARHEDIENTIVTNGKIEPDVDFQAHAPLATTVKKIYVHEGDVVKKGQLLVRLDDASARATAARALAQLRAAEADLNSVGAGGTHEEVLNNQAALVKAHDDENSAKRNMDAMHRLKESGAASDAEVQNAENGYKQAQISAQLLEQKLKGGRYSRPEVERVKAQAGEARATYDAAQDLLSNSNITAPRDGMVYALPVRESAYVNQGDLVVGVADLKHIQVRAFVDEPDIGRLAKGQRVDITWDAIPGRVWQGTITRIPTSVSLQGSRTVGQVTAGVDNSDLKLLPNVNVNVTVITAEHPNALTVPREAVRQDKNGARYVFRIENDEIKRVPVETAVSSLTRIEIAKGLNQGDRVALASVFGHELRDGMRVKTD